MCVCVGVGGSQAEVARLLLQLEPGLLDRLDINQV